LHLISVNQSIEQIPLYTYKHTHREGAFDIFGFQMTDFEQNYCLGFEKKKIP